MRQKQLCITLPDDLRTCLEAGASKRKISIAQEIRLRLWLSCCSPKDHLLPHAEEMFKWETAWNAPMEIRSQIAKLRAEQRK